MAGAGEEAVVADSLSETALTVLCVPGSVLGAKDKAVSKAAGNAARRTHR